jgi:membrane-associated protein
MLQQFLELLATYGLAVLLPVLLLSAVGVPLPGSLLLVAAGAVAGGGQIALPLLILGATIATLLGNGLGYWLGWQGGRSALSRWGGRFHLDADRITQARASFTRHGLLSVLFSRFPLSPISAIVNILAGTAHYPFRPFVLVNIAGVTVWSSVYAGLGYVFGANWQAVADNVSTATQILTVVVVVVIAVVFGLRLLRQHHTQGDRA